MIDEQALAGRRDVRVVPAELGMKLECLVRRRSHSMNTIREKGCIADGPGDALRTATSPQSQNLIGDSVDYFDMLKKAWEITWRNKALWGSACSRELPSAD